MVVCWPFWRADWMRPVPVRVTGRGWKVPVRLWSAAAKARWRAPTAPAAQPSSLTSPRKEGEEGVRSALSACRTRVTVRREDAEGEEMTIASGSTAAPTAKIGRASCRERA